MRAYKPAEIKMAALTWPNLATNSCLQTGHGCTHFWCTDYYVGQVNYILSHTHMYTCT